MNRLTADLALLLSAAVWGTAFLFQKSALEHVGPLTFVAARCAIAAAVLAPAAWLESRDPARPADRPLLMIAMWAGVAFFLGAWLQQSGLATATVTNASFLTALYVIITPFIAWVWNGRAPSAAVWPAVALSAAGTWLLGGGTLGAFSAGDGLIAASAVLWAAHVVISGQAAPFGRPITFTALQFTVVAMLAGTAATALETPALSGLVAARIELAYVGLLSSALTFTLLTVALQHTPPSEAAVIVSLETVFAALAGYIVLGERLSVAGFTGAGLILLAILCIQIGPGLAGRRRPSP